MGKIIKFPKRKKQTPTTQNLSSNTKEDVKKWIDKQNAPIDSKNRTWEFKRPVTPQASKWNKLAAKQKDMSLVTIQKETGFGIYKSKEGEHFIDRSQQFKSHTSPNIARNNIPNDLRKPGARTTLEAEPKVKLSPVTQGRLGSFHPETQRWIPNDPPETPKVSKNGFKWRTAAKVAGKVLGGAVGVAAEIAFPKELNKGEDEWLRNLKDKQKRNPNINKVMLAVRPQ